MTDRNSGAGLADCARNCAHALDDRLVLKALRHRNHYARSQRQTLRGLPSPSQTRAISDFG